MPTADRSKLPGLLILGAPKSGTTTLAVWWNAHPRGYTAPEKEVGYFTPYPDRGLDWYASRFAAADEGQVTCDASPGYMYDDAALDLIRRELPDARLAVVLREPVSRVWSHWCYNAASGIDGRSFDKVLRRELVDESVTPPHFPIGYLYGSRYVARLRAITERFPREQLLVLLTDDLRDDPAGAFARLCAHAGLSPVPPVETGVRNAARFPRSRRLQRTLLLARAGRWPLDLGPRLTHWNNRMGAPPLADHHRRLLQQRLAGESTALAEFLGRPLPDSWYPA